MLLLLYTLYLCLRIFYGVVLYQLYKYSFDDKMSEHVHSMVIFVFSTSTNKHIATEKKKKPSSIFMQLFYTVANWNCCLEEGCLSCVYKYSHLCSHW